MHNREKWDQNKVVINNIFVFQVALDIIINYENLEPQNVENVDKEMTGQHGKKLCRKKKLINETRRFWTYSPNN